MATGGTATLSPSGGLGILGDVVRPIGSLLKQLLVAHKSMASRR